MIEKDPDVSDFVSFFGPSYGNTQNTGRFVIGLKLRDDRNASASQIIDRLRPKLAQVPGARLFLQPAQDITVGGRIARGQFQYVLQDPDLHELNLWAPRLLAKLKKLPQLADVATDAQNAAPLLTVTINRDAAARFGIQPQLIDDTLNDAFGQRQVTQYFTNNSYYLVLEVLPQLQGSMQTLDQIYIRAPTTGQLIPLSTLVTVDTNHIGPLLVSHSGQFPAVTLTFNLPPGVALSQAVDAIQTGRRRDRHAVVADRHLPGQRAGVPGGAVERAGADRRRAGRRLCHPRRALRELHPSADDSVDAAVGRRRRAARALARRLRPLGDRHHRHHSADRHRQEERHHAGRLRHQPRTRRPAAARSGAAGLPAALPPDHHDDDDGAARAACR